MSTPRLSLLGLCLTCLALLLTAFFTHSAALEALGIIGLLGCLVVLFPSSSPTPPPA